jgi:hypothetical protein
LRDFARTDLRQLDTATGLYAPIEAVRLEVQTMPVKRSYLRRGEFGPEWIKDIPWKRSA